MQSRFSALIFSPRSTRSTVDSETRAKSAKVSFFHCLRRRTERTRKATASVGGTCGSFCSGARGIWITPWRGSDTLMGDFLHCECKSVPDRNESKEIEKPFTASVIGGTHSVEVHLWWPRC